MKSVYDDLIPHVDELGEGAINEEVIRDYGERVRTYNTRRWLYVFGVRGMTLKVLLDLFEAKGYKVTRSDTADNRKRYKVEW